MPVVIACSACQNKMRVSEQLAGKAVKCPKCAQVVKVPGAAPAAAAVAGGKAAPPPAPTPAAPPAPAGAKANGSAGATPAADAAPPIPVSCDGCQKKLQVRAALAGKAIKCPGCGKVIKVPAPPAPADQGEEWLEVNEAAAPPPAPAAEEPVAAAKKGPGASGDWGQEALTEHEVPDEMLEQFRSEMTKGERILWASSPWQDNFLHNAKKQAYSLGHMFL